MWLRAQIYAAPILFERNAYEVPVFTRVHDFMWSGAGRLLHMTLSSHAYARARLHVVRCRAFPDP